MDKVLTKAIVCFVDFVKVRINNWWALSNS